MKLKRHFLTSFVPSGPIAILLVMSLAATPGFSATLTWDGGPTTTGTDLGVAENWSTDVLPNPTTPDIALWDGTVAGPLSLIYTNGAFAGVAGDLGINLEVAATQTSPLNIDSGANIVAARINSLSVAAGAGAVTLGDGAGTFNLTIGGTAGQTHNWTNQSSTPVLVQSDVRFGLGGAGIHTLALGGAGSWTLAGIVTPVNAAQINILKTGTGTANLTGSGTIAGNNTNANLPNPALVPLVAREGTLLFNGGTYNVTGEAVIGGVVTHGGAGQNAKIQVDAGTVAVSSWLSVGRGNGIGGVSSDLVANNGSIITTGEFSAGFNGGNAANLPKGTITLNQTSSLTINGNGAFNLAESPGSNMTFTANNSAQFVAAGTGIKRIGNLGTGVLNINDTATVTLGNQLTYLGYRSGNGTLNMSGGTLTANGEVRVGGSDTNNGAAENSVGTLNVSGGTANLSALVIARGNNNAAICSGTGTISGGTVNSVNDVVLGYAGANNLGKLTVSGGTLNVGTAAAKWLQVGVWDTSKGQLDVTSGSVRLLNNTQIKMNSQGTVGANVINQSGGAVTFYGDAGTTVGGTGHLDLQRAGAAASNNTYNLNGGVLTVPQILSTATTGTRVFNFNGGTLRAAVNQAGFVNLGAGNARANVRDLGAIIDSNGFNVTVAQPLLHSDIGGDLAIDGGLTKLSAGNLTLTATNTYTGATAVSGGTLTLGNGADVNSSSGITISGSGAKLVQDNFATISTPVTLTQGALDGKGTIDSLTVANSLGNTISAGAGTNTYLATGSLVFQGAATLDLRAGGTVSDQYISTDTLTTSPSADVVINATNTAGVWTSGTVYPLINFNTYGTVDASHFTLGTVPGLNPNQSATLVNTGSSIALSVTGESLVWKGTPNANWTNGVTQNWSYLASPITFSTNSPVIFDDTASNFNVNLGQNVSPSAIVFANDTNDYVISSSGGFGITTGTLVLNGLGKVTLATNNTYTGATVINAGILEISGTGSIATSSSITNNGSLVFNLSGGGNVYANPIGGTGSVTKQGVGSLTLSGNNTFSGDFILDAGSLNINSGTALGAGPGVITINGGVIDNTSGAAVASTSTKTQIWNFDITFTGSNSLSMGTGGVTLSGSGTSRTVNVVANTFGVGGVSGFGYDLIKTGAGTLHLNSVSNISGILDIQNGIVGTAQDLTAAGLTGAGLLQNSGTVETKWTFWNIDTDQSSGTLIRNNDGTNNFQLGIVKQGSATWTLTNNSNNATSNLSVTSGKLILNNTGTYGARNNDGSTATNLTAVVGNAGGINGVLEINGATVNYNNRSNVAVDPWRSTLSIGNNATGAGALKFTVGTLTTDKQLGIGTVGGAFGAMTQAGGNTTVGGFLALGLGNALGVLNLTGGSYTQNGPATNAAGAGSIGLINIGGNAVYNQTSVGDLGLWIGENGAGFLNVSGTASLTIASGNNGLQLGRNASGSGMVNLLGGTVTVKSLYKGAGGGKLNFNGGTLAANLANATFLTGLESTHVHTGGGTINNNGNAITIVQPLLAPTGNGVSASGLTFSGGGFIDTPIVQITGDGTGATGVANIDANGQLTGITITNPGIDYTFASVSLVGGGIGNNGLVGGSPGISPNASGGMTFSGAAITTLAGINTYTGNTTVQSGSAILLADNAALQFAPGANGVSNKVTGAGSAYFYGDFNINLAGAAIADNNAWVLVDTSVRTFDPLTFTVPGFTETSAGVHQFVDGANTWTFTESTGELMLDVAAAGGFASWIGGYGSLPLDQRDENDDYDADGFDNLLEYVLGGDPTVSSTAIAPTAVKSGSNFVVSFSRSDLSEVDTAVVIEYGNNLAGWTPVTVPVGSGTVDGVTFTIDEGTPGTNPDAVTATIPTSGVTKFFARVKAVK